MDIPRERLIENDRRLKSIIGEEDIWRAPDDAIFLADRAVEGKIRFAHLGYRLFEVGRSNIDWSAPQTKHQEWPAQLNRFFQLPALMAAWKETRDERYPAAARDYIEDWIRAHPVRDDWTPARYDNTLNLAIRIQNWLSTLPGFLDSGRFGDPFVASLVASAACQLDFLCGHLAPVHNWRIAHADSILTASLRLDGLPAAARWRKVGVGVINDAFRRQVLPDGAHDERNPNYHGWMTRVFEKYWRIGRAMPELGLTVDADTVSLMHDYLLAHTRPNGQLNALHDSTGARTGSRPPSWADARRAFRRDAGLPDEMPPTIQNFPFAGQACWRDSWGEDAVYVVFDATTWGGGHCHLSRNSLQIHAFGRSLLVDPGTLTYEASDPMMAHGKSTRAHNTMNLNGWNQSEADPKFRFESVEGYCLAASVYSGGFWPRPFQWGWKTGHGSGLWGEHHRVLLWLRGLCLVVLDRFRHDTPETAPKVESNWQFSEGTLEMSSDPCLKAVTGHGDANLLCLFPLVPGGTTPAIHAGEKNPPRGWLPGTNGEYVAAPQLCLESDPAPVCSHWAAVFVPFEGKEAPAVSAEARMGRTGRLVIAWGDGSTDSIWWMPGLERALEPSDGIETDGSLVHLRRGAGGEPVRGLVADGTYLEPYSPRRRPRRGVFSFGRWE